MAGMMKLGLQGIEGTIWDESGNTRIVQILISHQQDLINSIQFFYYSKYDGNIIGDPTGLKFNTVVFDHPSEFLISISGGYINRTLVSIAFHTNKKKYGPFGGTVDRVSIPASFQEFKYDFGPMYGREQKCCFGGFHGTVFNGCVNSIGVYVKPLKPTTILDVVEEIELEQELTGYGRFGEIGF